MRGFRQLVTFCEPGTHLQEGRGFENLVLGLPPDNSRILTQDEKKWQRGLRSPFEKALFVSTIGQPPGYPWGTSGYQSDHMLQGVRRLFPTTERESIYLFSVLHTELDRTLDQRKYQFHTDFFFFHRGIVARGDLTVNESKNPFFRVPLVFLQSHLGDHKELEKFCQKAKMVLEDEKNLVSMDLFKTLRYRIKYVYKK